MTPSSFGCDACWPDDPASAKEAQQDHEWLARPCDESHFSVTILACKRCGQRFVRIFYELIDWQGGDDSQAWFTLPITRAEADQLIAQGEAVDLRCIVSLGRGRTHLSAVHPRGSTMGVTYAQGKVPILPHD
jgi:hypothetical protein